MLHTNTHPLCYKTPPTLAATGTAALQPGGVEGRAGAKPPETPGNQEDEARGSADTMVISGRLQGTRQKANGC